MSFGNLYSATQISGSGLAAERMRMEVAANNIANANSTRTPGGGPYRRQEVVFQTVVDQFGPTRDGQPRQAAGLNGVQVVEVATDSSPLPKIFNPGHPDASPDGFVQMPNVNLPVEMIDLMTASRSYEANLKSLQTFRDMAEQSLSLMKPTS